MSNRLKRGLVLLSLGGMTFFWGLWGGNGCYQFAQSAPYVNFLVDAGNYAVDVGVDNALANVPQNYNDWFNDPITNLYQDIWTGYVQYNYPEDPTYNTLLVN